jgi:hypothetical protein
MSIWFRNVPWATGDHWRTDIQANTLSSNEYRFARFALKRGPIVQVPMEDLRLALEHAPHSPRRNAVGPFNINPSKSLIEVKQHQTKVRMEFVSYDDLEPQQVTKLHKAGHDPARSKGPRVPQNYLGFADTVLEQVVNGGTTYQLIKQRLEELNPTLSVKLGLDGSISRDELAYCMRVNYLRTKNPCKDLL